MALAAVTVRGFVLDSEPLSDAAADADADAELLLLSVAAVAVEKPVAKPVAKKAEKPAAQKKTKAPAEKPTEVAVQAKPVAAVVQAAAPVQAKPAAEEEGEEEEGEEAEIDVQLFKWNGVSYLLSADGVVYDKNTNEPLGVWNAKENKIVFDGPESEDELCATEVMDESEGEDDDLAGMCSAMGACAIVAEVMAV